MCHMFSSCLTLRVDVWVRVCAGADAEQRLRTDAAEIHVVDIRHHAGHHSLVEQRRTSYLGKLNKNIENDVRVGCNLCKLPCS